MNVETREKISASQRQNWASRRAADEQLEALRASHRRVLEALDLCAVFVGMKADEGDPFARYLNQRVEMAHDGLAAENIAASTLIEEHTPTPDTGNAAG